LVLSFTSDVIDVCVPAEVRRGDSQVFGCFNVL
jgi:hypothetical protein